MIAGIATPRQRAIRYVTALIQEYESWHRDEGMGGAYHRMVLRRELATMQAEGQEGETLAGRWDFLIGDLVKRGLVPGQGELAVVWKREGARRRR